MTLIPYSGSLLAKTVSSTAPAGLRSDMIRACVTLAKPRIVSLVLFTAVAACFAAAGGAPPPGVVLLLVLSGTLAAGGAAALNHYFDRDIDGWMARTRERPLVRGEISRPWLVLLAGASAIVAGVLLAATVNLVLSAFELAGAFVYVVVYTLWLKRRTSLNIVVGGFAGTSAVIGGWAAVDPGLGLVPWLLGGLVFLWTPAHFWSLALARRAEYEQARVPMLPVVAGTDRAAWWAAAHVLATVGVSIWLGLAASFGPIYFGAALVAGLAFLNLGIRLARRPGQVTGLNVYRFSGPYLGLVFLGILVESLARSYS